MSKINKIKGRQVFDSRGNPTIEVEIFQKLSASAICPSGASTELMRLMKKRFKDKKYLGKGVNKSVNIINNFLSKKLIGLNVHEQVRMMIN